MIEVLSNTTYQLNLPVTWKIYNMFHGTLLTCCIENPKNGQLFKEPLPELVEGKPEYEVEEILNTRQMGQGHKLQYLVKWKGYSAAHNSWELHENVHAPTLLKEFYEKQPKAIRTIRISFGN